VIPCDESQNTNVFEKLTNIRSLFNSESEYYDSDVDDYASDNDSEDD
jgi:hypothetical protein